MADSNININVFDLKSSRASRLLEASDGTTRWDGKPVIKAPRPKGLHSTVSSWGNLGTREWVRDSRSRRHGGKGGDGFVILLFDSPRTRDHFLSNKTKNNTNKSGARHSLMCSAAAGLWPSCNVVGADFA